MLGSRTRTRALGSTTQPPGEDLGPHLNQVVWSLAALSALFLGLRLFSKLSRRRALWWDDYVLVASWIALLASVILQSIAVAHGLGKLFRELDVQSIDAITMYSMAAGFGTILATCWSKTSFAMSLLRISTGRVKWFLWFILVSVNVVLGSNAVMQYAQCWPVEKRWHFESMEGSCLPPEVIQSFNVFVAAYSALMDIVLALLPWKIIWTITINKKEKLGALIAMSAGVVSGIMAILKILTLHAIGNQHTTTVDIFIFGTAEPATAIMAASIPLLRTLIRREPHPKPTQFIELADPRRKHNTSPPPDSPAEGISRQESAREWWAKVSHLEAARLRGKGDTTPIQWAN